ncbi:MAG: hypothetical protein KatS3mg085_463 [Candidatus Dojkabacteria bacterium]|nr:MAG: hypothetical protein KatS3mg085_463 [Candidatus Dojkabacteria bacterium]
MSEFLITHIGWSKKGQKYLPVLEWFRLDNHEFQKVELDKFKNFDFTKQSSKKFCIGYYDELEGKKPCPRLKLIDEKYERCFECEEKNQLKSILFFGKTPTTQGLKNYFNSEHLVYLAYFEPNILKVGTVNIKRSELRLLEQDAQAYVFIARTPNAESAWKLEKYLSKRFGLTTAVQSKTKFSTITLKPNLDKIKTLLNQKTNEIEKNIDENYFEFLLTSKNINSFFQNDIIFYPETLPKKMTKASKIKGVFKGLRGNYLILESEQNYFAYSKKDLVGYRISYV